jgi:hypothetical protein
MVDLRPDVRRPRRDLLEGSGNLFAIFEQLAGLCTVEVEEVIHRRTVEVGMKVPDARE